MKLLLQVPCNRHPEVLEGLLREGAIQGLPAGLRYHPESSTPSCLIQSQIPAGHASHDTY